MPDARLASPSIQTPKAKGLWFAESNKTFLVALIHSDDVEVSMP